MTDKKINSRASQTKIKEHKKVWTPPSSLDAPPAPDGFRHRWIRAESMGFDDTKNMTGKIRSGWELERADEYPETEYPTLKEGKYAFLFISRTSSNYILTERVLVEMYSLDTL